MKEISKEGENDVLLVCTVGGAPRPVALSIIQHKPKRVLFIASKESKSQISRQGFKKRNESTREIDGRGILQICRDEKFDLDPGRYTIAEVEHQELQSCIETVREYVRQEIDQWAGNQPTVIFDFTGGTKLMTAALAMIGRQLPIEFSYVASKEKSDGNDARDKNGLGVTLDGEENVLRLRNPWDALGYQSIETAVMLFNQGNFAAAKQIVEDHRNKVNDRCSKQQLVTWAQLFSGYLCWDQSDHKKAQQHILDVLKNFANIQRWLLRSSWQTIEVKLKKDEDFIQQLNKGSNRNTLLDLLSNAGRRAHEGRYDDAVARMYRAIEAAAQFRLKEHGIDSSSVNKGQVPESLQKKWCSRFKPDETIKLALQDDYEFLNALGNPLGNRFFEKELNKEQSPLGIRNSSILAHGFTPVSEKAYTKLRDITLDLLEIEKGELMVFPELRI